MMKFVKRPPTSTQSVNKDDFLKFTDGETKSVILRGEVFGPFRKLWANGKSTIVPDGTPGSKESYRVNAAVHDGEKFVMRVWEFGAMIYDTLAAIADEYEITQTKLKVTRDGTGLTTEWLVMPAGPKDQVTPKQLKEIEALELHAIEVTVAPKQEESA